MEEFKGVWVVAVLDGTRGYFGMTEHAEWHDGVKEEILAAPILKLAEAFDFFSPIQSITNAQGQTLGIQRQPVLMGLDFTTDPTPVYVRWQSLIFFDEMTDSDKAGYQRMHDNVRMQMLEARTQRMGIKTPTPEEKGRILASR